MLIWEIAVKEPSVCVMK